MNKMAMTDGQTDKNYLIMFYFHFISTYPKKKPKAIVNFKVKGFLKINRLHFKKLRDTCLGMHVWKESERGGKAIAILQMIRWCVANKRLGTTEEVCILIADQHIRKQSIMSQWKSFSSLDF